MTDHIAALRELEQTVREATGPDRELDELIALRLAGWSSWISKHRYWNIDGPCEQHLIWPDSPIPNFDPVDGKKIELIGDPPHGWGYQVDLPVYTASLDACALLQEERLPGYFLRVEQRNDGSFDTALSPINDAFVFRLHADERLSRLLAIVHAYIAQEEGK